MRLPPVVSIRKDAWPSHVSVVSAIGLLFSVAWPNVPGQDRPTRGRTYPPMGSRVLPLSFGLAALLADLAGLHGVATYAVLLAVPGAAAAGVLPAPGAPPGGGGRGA